MRLGTCIVLELAVAAGAVGGVWFGIGQASRLAGTYLVAHEAAAATSSSAPLTSLPRAHLDVSVTGPVGPQTVFPRPDDELLAPLGATPVKRVKLNHGGTSLSLRVDFASGARAAFKPEQIHPQSDPRREIAAYRIDRLLEIGHVPPAKSVTIPVSELIGAADPAFRTLTADRLADEAIVRDGSVRGELSWWIPELKLARIGTAKIDEDDGIVAWSEYLQPGAKIPAAVQPMVAQIATCILFDILIDNSDRWSGSNTLGSADDSTLYFMDNTLSFSVFTFGHKSNLGPLQRIGVFPRRLVERLRGLTYDRIAVAVAGDERFGSLLEPAQIRALLTRRDHLVQYIDRVTAQFGEAAVLALP